MKLPHQNFISVTLPFSSILRKNTTSIWPEARMPPILPSSCGTWCVFGIWTFWVFHFFNKSANIMLRLLVPRCLICSEHSEKFALHSGSCWKEFATAAPPPVACYTNLKVVQTFSRSGRCARRCCAFARKHCSRFSDMQLQLPLGRLVIINWSH